MPIEISIEIPMVYSCYFYHVQGLGSYTGFTFAHAYNMADTLVAEIVNLV